MTRPPTKEEIYEFGESYVETGRFPNFLELCKKIDATARKEEREKCAEELKEEMKEYNYYDCLPCYDSAQILISKWQENTEPTTKV